MITLQPFTTTDFDKLISWADSEEVLVQFAGSLFSYPLTATQLTAYLAEPNRFPFKVVDSKTGLTIGHAEINLAADATSKLCRIIIGNQRNRGKGIGQHIMHQLLQISFSRLATQQAELNVFDWNLPAIKCYEKVGFAINPDKCRTLQVNGKTWTARNMIIAKSKWEQLKKIG